MAKEETSAQEEVKSNVDQDGNTPLHLLTNHAGDVRRAVERLIEERVEIDMKNKNGDTALHVAAKQGKLELCKVLLEYGASPLERNNKNRIPKSQPRISEEIKAVLLEAEEEHKVRRQERDSRLWDERMKKTQTDSAYGLRVV